MSSLSVIKPMTNTSKFSNYIRKLRLVTSASLPVNFTHNGLIYSVNRIFEGYIYYHFFIENSNLIAWLETAWWKTLLTNQANFPPENISQTEY